ncbi:MAG TPA: dihydropteroate synthase [Gaiellales bacterium]|nr:dihydropteroate synthase [Gaiellales bacterium]
MNLAFASRSLALGGPPRIMGIVNVTPDSFYDRGLTADGAAAVRRGVDMVAAGADLLDVGGMTAQPGEPLSAAAEIDRVAPVVRELRAQTGVPIAVDTYRAEVAAAALAAGADLVNDHTGLADPDLAGVVAARRAGLVVTHLGLQPKQEQEGRYSLPFDVIAASLTERAERALAAGVPREGILVDPGLGFGKDTATDLETLRRLPELRALGFPVLLAPSHKEVTAEPLGLPEEALEGTAAVVAVAAYLGVDVLRVHDLPFMARVARMGWLIRSDGSLRGD